MNKKTLEKNDNNLDVFFVFMSSYICFIKKEEEEVSAVTFPII